MAANNFCLCNTCETEFSFPALDADQNCPGSPSLSQITGLLVVPDGAALPDDWTLKADWETVIDNDDTTNAFGKYMTGIGSVDTPEKTTIQIAKGVTVTTIRTYTATLEIFNLSDVQYEALRALQCNPTNYVFWLENAGGHIFGGASGLTPFLTDVDFPLGAGESDFERAVLTIQWRAKCDPPRTYIENLSENFAGLTDRSRVFGAATNQVFGFSTTDIFGF